MKNTHIEVRNKAIYCDRVPFLTPYSHIHNDLELVYVKKGYVKCHADNKVYETYDKGIFLCFPNQFHYYLDVAEGEYYLFIFSPEILYNLTGILENNLPQKNIFITDSNPYLEELIEKIISEKGDFKETIRAGLLNELVALILRQTELVPRTTTSSNTINSILSYCQDHYRDNISLDSMAEDLHISKYHISHIFNDNLGISFNKHINSLRIKSACELIKESDYTMSYIAEEVGFGSIRSFNRAFIQIMKTTPLKYKISN